MELPGINVDVVDEAAEAVLPTATDTCYVISADANAPATPTLFTRAEQARSDFATATTMVAETDTFFGIGARRVYAIKVPAGETGLDDTLAKLPAELGPGNVVATGAQTAPDIAKVAAWALATNRVYSANGPAAATDDQLITLAAAAIAADDGRNAGIHADTAIIPGAGSSTREVPWAVVVAALMARNDIRPPAPAVPGNPNRAAAGVMGIPRYVKGIVKERSNEARTALTGGQINTAKTVAGQMRNYGYRTLADLDELPHWWDLGGSRTVMDVKAHATADSEEVAFGQIDGDQTLENSWNALLSRRCMKLLELGALFNKDANGKPVAPFTIDTSRAITPVSEIQQGRLHAEMTLRTSPYAEALNVTIVRRALAA